MTEIDITDHSSLWAGDRQDLHPVIREAVETALRHACDNREPSELSIVLADDAFIQALNKEWRGKDKPTNVLSFPQDEPGLLGDIILAHETIAREAAEQDKTFTDHLKHLVVHGVLHLLGHDHEDEDEAAVMERLEIEILEQLEVKNPYEIGDFMS